jgi:uncharacterized protein YebE (UPF0316 family)
MNAMLDLPSFQWMILPALIFLARICDVTIGTIRIIMVSKGLRAWAPLFGFFEVLIWLITIRQLMTNISSVVHYLAYAGGFAAGTVVGMAIENRLSLGKVIIRIITRRGGAELAAFLRDHGYTVTDLDAMGGEGPVRIIFTVIQRQNLRHVERIVKEFNPTAFYTIEDVRFVRETVTDRKIFPLVWPSANRVRLGK